MPRATRFVNLYLSRAAQILSDKCCHSQSSHTQATDLHQSLQLRPLLCKRCNRLWRVRKLPRSSGRRGCTALPSSAAAPEASKPSRRSRLAKAPLLRARVLAGWSPRSREKPLYLPLQGTFAVQLDQQLNLETSAVQLNTSETFQRKH